MLPNPGWHGKPQKYPHAWIDWLKLARKILQNVHPDQASFWWSNDRWLITNMELHKWGLWPRRNVYTVAKKMADSSLPAMPKSTVTSARIYELKFWPESIVFPIPRQIPDLLTWHKMIACRPSYKALPVVVGSWDSQTWVWTDGSAFPQDPCKSAA